MILIDAGFLIALTDPRDTLHGLSRRWVRAVVNQPLLLTSFVELEVINHFSSHPEARRRVHDVLERLRQTLRIHDVVVDGPLADAGKRLHRERPDQKWSLTDCVSFVVMQQRELSEALAYDRHFEQAGYVPLLRQEPT